jgi:hypothetical protein
MKARWTPRNWRLLCPPCRLRERISSSLDRARAATYAVMGGKVVAIDIGAQ